MSLFMQWLKCCALLGPWYHHLSLVGLLNFSLVGGRKSNVCCHSVTQAYWYRTLGEEILYFPSTAV